MPRIRSKKSQYSCSFDDFTSALGPALRASLTASAHCLLKNSTSDISSPTRQHGLHLQQQLFEVRRQADADIVELATQLHEEQCAHLVLGPAERLVVDLPAVDAGDGEDRAQCVVDLLDHRRVLAHC